MERKKWADIAKAIAIIAVLVGHTSGIPGILSRMIFTFHMPLFFIFSGYFLKRPNDTKSAVKKDARALLTPYIVTCVLTIVLAILRAIIFQQDVLNVAKEWLLASIYGSGGLIPTWWIGTRWIGAIWFLLALFFARYFIYYTERFGKYQGIAVMLIAYVGYVTTELTWLPFSIQAGMTATMYLYIGKIIRDTDAFNATYVSKNKAIYMGAVVVWIFCIKYCGALYMVNNTYGNGFLDVIGSICATFCIVWVSMFVERYVSIIGKILSWIGKLTLPILCAHILELNLFPWYEIFGYLDMSPHWIVKIFLRLVLVTIMCGVCYYIPIIGKIYFPRNERRAQCKKNQEGLSI